MPTLTWPDLKTLRQCTTALSRVWPAMKHRLHFTDSQKVLIIMMGWDGERVLTLTFVECDGIGYPKGVL